MPTVLNSSRSLEGVNCDFLQRLVMSRFGWLFIGIVKNFDSKTAPFLYFTPLLQSICMLIFVKERAAVISERTR